RKHLESAEQHGEAQDPFRGSIDAAVVSCYITHAGAEVGDAGTDGGEGGNQIQATYHQQLKHHDVHHHIHRKESPDRFHYPIRYVDTADLDEDNRIGEDQAMDLADTLFEEQQDADHLHAAARGAGAAAHKREDKQGEGKGGRPGDKVGGEAGGAECGGQVKKSDHQTVLCSVGVGDRQISHGDQGAYDDPAKVEAKFCIRKVVAQTFLPPDEEVQGEVCTGNQDEDGADQQDSVALKVTDALIVGGKSAVGDGGK